ncbi:MAG: hypothetical protein AAB116_04030 [Candidatus Poribacteria bacterium]
MAFKWSEYFDLAKFLYSNSSSFCQITQEAAYRSAVSRAYYAAFCHSREYARSNYGFVPTGTGEDHRLVRDVFRRRGISEISDRLKALHQWRKMCDYDNKVNNIGTITQKAIKETMDIFQTI